MFASDMDLLGPYLECAFHRLNAVAKQLVSQEAVEVPADPQQSGGEIIYGMVAPTDSIWLTQSTLPDEGQPKVPDQILKVNDVRDTDCASACGDLLETTLHVAMEVLPHSQLDALELGFLPFDVLFVVAIWARRGSHPRMTDKPLLRLA